MGVWLPGSQPGLGHAGGRYPSSRRSTRLNHHDVSALCAPLPPAVSLQQTATAEMDTPWGAGAPGTATGSALLAAAGPFAASAVSLEARQHSCSRGRPVLTPPPPPPLPPPQSWVALHPAGTSVGMPLAVCTSGGLAAERRWRPSLRSPPPTCCQRAARACFPSRRGCAPRPSQPGAPAAPAPCISYRARGPAAATSASPNKTGGHHQSAWPTNGAGWPAGEAAGAFASAQGATGLRRWARAAWWPPGAWVRGARLTQTGRSAPTGGSR